MVGGLDSSKKSFMDIYKMDLADTMKQVLAGAGAGSTIKQQQQAAQLLHQQMAAASMGAGSSGSTASIAGIQSSRGAPPATDGSGAGYVTEKLYMLLQLYLQNKGWNPSAELLQCFTELKDSAMLPSSDYLQVLANRMTLDSQGRLVLRESGKIVLPYEHFANAVMLKHMTGPHGLHLSVEATVRAVIDSYTIGRENFGMEKEFIIDVVQSCPNPACRYYKNHIGVAPTSFMDPATFQAAAVAQMSNEFMQQHLPSQISATPIPKNSSNSNSNSGSSTPLSLVTNDSSSSIDKAAPVQLDLTINKSRSTSDRHSSADRHSDKHSKAVLASQQQQQQLAAALIQQQNRAMAQQSLEKFGNLTAIEKQRVLQQLDKKHYEAVAAAAAGSNLTASQMQAIHDRNTNMVSPSMSSPHALHIPSTAQPQSMGIHASNTTAIQGQSPNSSSSSDVQQSFYRSSPVSQTGSHHTIESLSSGTAASGVLDSNSSTNKDLLALHNGAWAQQSSIGGAGHHSQQQHAPSGHLHSPVTASAPIITMPSDSPHNQQLAAAGQEKIIRAFGELMRNMARMKTYIRPSMCKPYGKQSEGLQKTLGDTIQLVQSLRSCLPAPHIPVSSWKTEDRHGEY